MPFDAVPDGIKLNVVADDRSPVRASTNTTVPPSTSGTGDVGPVSVVTASAIENESGPGDVATFAADSTIVSGPSVEPSFRTAMAKVVVA